MSLPTATALALIWKGSSDPRSLDNGAPAKAKYLADLIFLNISRVLLESKHQFASFKVHKHISNVDGPFDIRI